jgi:hypothetical protein
MKNFWLVYAFGAAIATSMIGIAVQVALQYLFNIG